MQSVINYIRYPRCLLEALLKKTYFLYTDAIYLRLMYWLKNGYLLHLDHPVTFTEKIQWLKLYERNPLYTSLVDKLAVKKYVAQKIGTEFVIPVLGIWNRAEDIDFNSLPNRFVLKVNCGGGNGNVYICRDKEKLDYKKICKSLNKGLKSGVSIYRIFREWPYKNIEPKIFAESLIEDGNKLDLIDYKFYCFNGEVRYCQVIKDRTTHETIDFYDTEWHRQPFYGLNPMSANYIIRPSITSMAKPERYEKMVEIAAKLSEGFPFVRVDLYNVDGAIYFGEMTFYPASGFGVFTPPEYDNILGELLTLPLNESK